MKKVTNLLLPALAIAVIMSIFLNGCSSCNRPPKDAIDTVAVNPYYIMHPPIADDVSIQKIDGDSQHVWLFAKFSKSKFSSKYLALMMDTEKIVLRDDGQGGDKVAGDGIFTAKIEDNIATIKNTINERNKQLATQGVHVHFVNRVMVTDTINEKLLSASQLDNFSPFSLSNILRFGPRTPLILPSNVIGNSLMVTDPTVVEDPTRTWNVCNQTGTVDGPWTFGTLMRQLASVDPAHIATDAQVSTFVLNWLKTWNANQTVNGEVVGARAFVLSTIVTPWLTASQAAGSPAGQLDMHFAPFKLMAIVNRLDLRGNSGYGPSNAGEGRFVFCLVLSCQPQPFNVIFEFGVNKTGCAAVQAYGKQWFDLSSLTLGSPAYNSALQAITDQFTKCGTNPSKPDQSSLDQLRTNEAASILPWELREFHVEGASGQQGGMVEVTVKQEPNEIYNGHIPTNTAANVDILANYVNSNQAFFIANDYEIRDSLVINGDTIRFLGGVSHTQLPPTGTPPNEHHWDGTVATGPGFITSDSARFILSLNTCSGCHGGETQTDFRQVIPNGFGTAATLSGFLTGLPAVPDAAARPAGGPVHNRPFSDLLRRALDLQNLVQTPCSGIFHVGHVLFFDPLRMVD